MRIVLSIDSIIMKQTYETRKRLILLDFAFVSIGMTEQMIGDVRTTAGVDFFNRRHAAGQEHYPRASCRDGEKSGAS